MIVANWNVRGVNQPFKQRELRSLILKYKISLIGLNETRVQEDNYHHIASGLMPGWRCITNYGYHPNGRVWVLWDPSIVSLQLVCTTDQLIQVDATVIQKQLCYYVSFIYGHNDCTLRRVLRSNLRALSSSLLHRPWLVLGDFNVVRNHTDRLGGAQCWPGYMEEFNDCCSDALLEDLQYTGSHFTWSKGSREGYKARKFDRALVNPAWFTEFSESASDFLEPGFLGHSPILVNTGI